MGTSTVETVPDQEPLYRKQHEWQVFCRYNNKVRREVVEQGGKDRIACGTEEWVDELR